jgi:hypothetical protein
MYIVKLSPSGNFFWAKQIAGPLYDYAYAIEPDALGNIYYTGFFEGTVDLDPNTPVYNLISAGSHDIFVSKLGGTITSVQQQNFEDKLMVYPVPASDHIIIHTSLSPSKLEMFDVNGRLFLTVNKEELQFINYDLYLSTDTISNGIYFLKISDELHFSTQKIVVQH